jgi:hypothetical protein
MEGGVQEMRSDMKVHAIVRAIVKLFENLGSRCLSGPFQSKTNCGVFESPGHVTVMCTGFFFLISFQKTAAHSSR